MQPWRAAAATAAWQPAGVAAMYCHRVVLRMQDVHLVKQPLTYCFGKPHEGTQAMQDAPC